MDHMASLSPSSLKPRQSKHSPTSTPQTPKRRRDDRVDDMDHMAIDFDRREMPAFHLNDIEDFEDEDFDPSNAQTPPR